MDINVRPLRDKDLDWADLVLTGGMITQQLGAVEVIRRAHARGKPVAVGGPDATSQPQVYEEADFIVAGEGEASVPLLVHAWESGQRSGRLRPEGPRPNLRTSPVPRFDLVRLGDYLYPGVQFSRGCCHDCEFCDIAARFGRPPRCKSPKQLLRELGVLRKAGHHGHVDIVDDNLIGHRPAAKAMLEALAGWLEKEGHPFSFSAQVTLSLAQDEELLALCRRCGLRYLFIGIETPDPDLLLGADKPQNASLDVRACVKRLNESGMMVLGGFILGFDREKPGAGKAVAACVEGARIGTAMAGLLTSLPDTRMDARLIHEKRLLVREKGAAIRPGESDQMTGGLNFIPLRPRLEILREYRELLLRLYAPSAFFKRVRGFLAWFRSCGKYRPRITLLPRLAWMVATTTFSYLLRPGDFPHFALTVASGLFRGTDAFAMAMMQSMFYLHLDKQTRHVVEHLDRQIQDVEKLGEEGYNAKRGAFIHRP